MKKIILLITMLAVIAAGWFLYLGSGDSTSAVSLSEAKYMDLKNTLEFSGNVVPVQMYGVMSETGGTIESVYVSEGSSVKKGDALFDLDTSQAQNLLTEAQLNYQILADSQSVSVMSQGTGLAEQKAKIALALSQTTGYDYESFNEAFSQQLADNAASMASNLDGMTLGDIAASGGDSLYNDKLALAELEVKRLEDQIESMSYKSLIDGVVLSINIHEGEVLSPGIPAMVVADTDNTMIDAYVYENDLNLIKNGMDVRIITDQGTFAGKITSIGKSAETNGTTSNFGTMTKIEITPDKDFKKIPGADVDLEIVLSQKKNVLALPLDCLTSDGYVYVVGKDDKLEKRQVTVGFKNLFYVEIVSGISEGEKVAMTPGKVKEGQRVSYD